MKKIAFLLFMLFVSAMGCCGYNAYIMSIYSQSPSNAANSTSPLVATPNQPTPAATPNQPPQGNSPPAGQMTSVKATFYTDVGTMADGHPSHVGACAAYLPQFPFGTMLKLYHPNDLKQPAYTCTVEDSGTHICHNNIDVWIASVPEALQLGVQDMQAQVVGVDQAIAQDAANNHPISKTGCELGPTH